MANETRLDRIEAIPEQAAQRQQTEQQRWEERGCKPRTVASWKDWKVENSSTLPEPAKAQADRRQEIPMFVQWVFSDLVKAVQG